MNSDSDENGRGFAKLSAAGWVAIIVLGLFLAAAVWYAVHAWSQLEGVGISALGWLFMGLGTVVTLGLGGGLMALVFYSSRKNFDQ